jgi:hypothetical protein
MICWSQIFTQTFEQLLVKWYAGVVGGGAAVTTLEYLSVFRFYPLCRCRN